LNGDTENHIFSTNINPGRMVCQGWAPGSSHFNLIRSFSLFKKKKNPSKLFIAGKSKRKVKIAKKKKERRKQKKLRIQEQEKKKLRDDEILKQLEKEKEKVEEEKKQKKKLSERADKRMKQLGEERKEMQQIIDEQAKENELLRRQIESMKKNPTKRTKMFVDESNNDPWYTIHMIHSHSSTLVVKGEVGGVYTNILLDTGADANILGKGWLDMAKKKKDVKIFHHETKVVGARSDAPLRTLGTTSQYVIFKGVTGKGVALTQFIVTNDYTGDVILGCPTLKSWGMNSSLREEMSEITFDRFDGLKLQQAQVSFSDSLRLDNREIRNLSFQPYVLEQKDTESISRLSRENKLRISKEFTWFKNHEKLVELNKEIVKELNQINKPTLVCMRAKKNSALLEMIDHLIAIPIVLRINKDIWLTGIVDQSKKAIEWRTKIKDLWSDEEIEIMINRANKVEDRDTKAFSNHVYKLIGDMIESEKGPSIWNGAGLGDPNEVDDDEKHPTPSVPSEKSTIMTHGQIKSQIRCGMASMTDKIASILLQNCDILGDPASARVKNHEHKIVLAEEKEIDHRRKTHVQGEDGKFLEQEVQNLLKTHMIEEAPLGKSPYVSPPVIVRKKDEDGRYTKKRLCVNYKALNKLTVKDTYSLPSMEQCLTMRSAKIFSKLDLASAYWQIPVRKQDRSKTAFNIGHKIYRWKYMPFGLTNAPATMQRLIDKVIGDAYGKFCYGYLDDVIVFSPNNESHLKHIGYITNKLKEYGLRIGLKKCEFFMDKIIFLGHEISHNTIKIDPNRVRSIQELVPPRNVKGLQKFLGIVGYVRRFINDYSQLVAPLTDLLRKETEWKWDVVEQRVFDILKQRVMEAPALCQPDFSKPFEVETDASDNGLGGALLQWQDGSLKPLAFISRKLNSTEQRYATREKEFMAILWSIEKFSTFLWGRDFTVWTDHKGLQWAQRLAYDNSRIGRWTRRLSEYTFEIKFRSGIQNTLADGLSRAEIEPTSVVINALTRRKKGSKKSKGKKPTGKNKSEKPDKKSEELEDKVQVDGVEAKQAKEQPAIERKADVSDKSDEKKQSDEKQKQIVADEKKQAMDEKKQVVDEKKESKDAKEQKDAMEEQSDDEKVEVEDDEKQSSDNKTVGEEKTKDSLDESKTPKRHGVDASQAEAPGFLEKRRKTVPEDPDETIYEIPDTRTWQSYLVKDREWNSVISFLEGSYIPKTIEERIRLQKFKSFFEVEQGVLYHLSPTKGGGQKKLTVVPENFVNQVLRFYHDHPLKGHRGAEIMKKLISQQFWWTGMRQRIEEYARSCLQCFLAKTPNPKNHGLIVQWGTMVKKFEVVHVDFVGPLGFTTKDGNKFIFTMKDRGSGFFDAIAIREQTAKEAAKQFWERWICRFGVPKRVISDQGKQFLSGLFKDLSKRIGFDLNKTTSYHPQGNGSIERDHRTLGAYLKIACIRDPTSWDSHIATFCFSLNATPRDRTTFSPFYIMYGDNPRLPLIRPDLKLIVYDTISYVTELCVTMDQALRTVNDENQKREKKIKEQSDRLRTDVKYALGTVVFKRTKRPTGTASKFFIPWKGPYRVTKQCANGVDYEITDLSGTERIHVEKLASFTSRTTISETDDIDDFLTQEEMEIMLGLKKRAEEEKAKLKASRQQVDESDPDEPAEQEIKVTKPQGSEVKLKRLDSNEISGSDFAIVALGKGEERLYKIAEKENSSIVGERYDPRHEKDSGPNRQFGPTYWDTKAKKSSVGASTWNSHCEVFTDIIPLEDILLTFPNLDRMKIPFDAYQQFEKIYKRKPFFPWLFDSQPKGKPRPK